MRIRARRRPRCSRAIGSATTQGSQSSIAFAGPNCNFPKAQMTLLRPPSTTCRRPAQHAAALVITPKNCKIGWPNGATLILRNRALGRSGGPDARQRMQVQVRDVGRLSAPRIAG